MRSVPKRLCAVFLLLLCPWRMHSQQTTTPSGTSSKTHNPSVHAPSANPDAGAVNNGVYRNSFFGFSCKIPFGWVERTREMSESDEPGKSMLLLAVFERPPEAVGSTVNSAVVITAEKTSSFSGMKTAEDYFGPITELATAKGFKVVNQPYEFPVGARHLVRGDYQKERGSVTMHQSSLVTLAKGYAVSFTIIGGSEDEVAELIENLHFGAAQKPSPKKSP
jgi:hypothetical protein